MNCETSALTLFAPGTMLISTHDMPISAVIKAFIKAEITADDDFANSSDSDCDSDVSAHAPLSDEAILSLFRSDMEESDLSGFSAWEDYVTVRFAVIVPFT